MQLLRVGNGHMLNLWYLMRVTKTVDKKVKTSFHLNESVIQSNAIQRRPQSKASLNSTHLLELERNEEQADWASKTEP